jgi:HAAS domain-containing protein
MKSKQTDVVGAYLHEVDLRLSGLPLLQRRELLADLAAHVATERTEREIQTEGELIEVLERLGSPEAVAASAYAEAGPYRPVPPVRTPKASRSYLWPAVIGGAVLLLVLVFCGVAFFAQTSSMEGPPPTQTPAGAN